MNRLLTTDEAAARLSVTPRRVRAMIQSGRLPARRHGRAWIIFERDLAAVRDRKPGRPRQKLR